MRDGSATGDDQHKTLAKLGANPRRQGPSVNLTKALQSMPMGIGIILQNYEFMVNCCENSGQKCAVMMMLRIDFVS